MNLYGSIRLCRWWIVLVSVVTALLFGFVLVREFIEDAQTPYGDYPAWMLGLFGWGSAVAVVLIAFIVDRTPRRPNTPLETPPLGEEPHSSPCFCSGVGWAWRSTT